MMSQLRKDPITREWAVIASEDAHEALRCVAHGRVAAPCPFCPGQEALSGPELLAYRPASTRPDTPGWQVRVVQARSPAFDAGDPCRRDYLLYDSMQAVGAREIVVETPQHEASLADQEPAQVEDVLWAVRERVEALARHDWVRYISVYREHGPGAGHPRTELLAAPVVPQAAWDHVRGLREYYDYRGRCAICHIIEAETEIRERVVHQNRGCLTLAPYASRRPFELWLLPTRHSPGIAATETNGMRHLAAALKDALLRLKIALDDPPYSCRWLTAPFHLDHADHVHWNIAIIPHLAVPGTPALSCDLAVNPVPPEQAARLLRAAVASTLEAAAGRR